MMTTSLVNIRYLMQIPQKQNCEKTLLQIAGLYQIYSKRDVSLQTPFPSVTTSWVFTTTVLILSLHSGQNAPQHLTTIKILHGNKSLSGLPLWGSLGTTCFTCFIHFVFVFVHFLNFKTYLDNTSPVQPTYLGSLPPGKMYFICSQSSNNHQQ